MPGKHQATTTRLVQAAWVLAAVFLVAAAALAWWRRLHPGAPAGDTTHAPALATLPARAPEGDRGWFDAFLDLPLQAQGAAPAGWSTLEASLAPGSCGTCHPAQYEDWKQSLHASAMGPGTIGQLLDWDRGKPSLVRSCQSCHGPLSEQLPLLEGGSANPAFQAELRGEGITCAACHVREHTRYGPYPGHGPPAAPHAGFVAQPEFTSPLFCERCHDFRPGQRSLRGKLLQETFQEWRRTSFAALGITCQSCHMPGHRHLWKGIHDPEMVRRAVTAKLEIDSAGGLLSPLRARFTITNTGAGHRFPTYTTPQVNLVVEQLDADGRALPSTRREAHVARRVEPDLTEEIYDTRLLPGQSRTLDYSVPRSRRAASLSARLEVWPDEGYRRFYEIKLRRPGEHPAGRHLLEQALEHSRASRYVAWERSVPLDQGS